MMGRSIFCETERMAWVIAASGHPDRDMYSRPAGCAGDRRIEGVCLASLVCVQPSNDTRSLPYSPFTSLHSQNRCRIFPFASWMDAFVLTANFTRDAALPLTLRRQRILHTTS
jgi:hypothetical protein